MTLQNIRLPSIQTANVSAAPSVQPVSAPPPAQQPPAVQPQIAQQSVGGGGVSFQPLAIQSQLPADVDPTTVSYYHVTVGDEFTYNKVIFRPGKIYQVAPALYLGTLDDGSTFASHCTQINPQPKIDQ